MLLEKDYEVHGIIRRSSNFNTQRIEHIYDKLKLHYGDLTDGLNVHALISKIKPSEIYNLGAQSHVRVSFDIPIYTADATGLGAGRILESIKEIDPSIKYYQASSSEMFGQVQETPQTETTPFYPRSPYGCAKVYAYWMTRNYREAYNMFTCNGILFNHESPRRGNTFVTKKIINAVMLMKKQIIRGKIPDPLYLGNLNAKRDWGYAKEYMQAAWLMMQHAAPDDYVIATNEAHTIREFLQESFSYLKMDYDEALIKIDSKYYRPTEVEILRGDYSKAKKVLGWEPKVKFKELIKLMIDELI